MDRSWAAVFCHGPIIPDEFSGLISGSVRCGPILPERLSPFDRMGVVGESHFVAITISTSLCLKLPYMIVELISWRRF